MWVSSHSSRASTLAAASGVRIAEDPGRELAQLGDQPVVLDLVRLEARVGVQPHQVLLGQEVGVGEDLELVHQHDAPWPDRPR